MADLNAIAESLSGLTILEAGELVKMLESKWGVSAAAAVAAAPAGATATGAQTAAPAAAQTEFTVVLASFDAAKKIGVIKEVRAITGLGLKEAKDLVESVPKPLKEGVSKDDAEKFKKQLADAGAVVELK